MAKTKNQPRHEGIQDIESALTRTEQFIEDNQKIITTIVAVVVLLVSAYLGYKRFIKSPRDNEALAQMFVAEKYFERDSFNLALYGDGNYLGFLDIIDDYSITSSANLAYYYAGISYLHMGDYQSAIDHLKKFRSRDEMLAPIARGAMGDAYMEMGDRGKAIEHYLKAANMKNNQFLSPLYLMKAAQHLEEEGNFKQALDAYRRIRNDFPESTEARDIEKFIISAELNIRP